jgi:hypothetical protein
MTQDQQRARETNNLLKCLILSQLQVYIIDDIQNDNKFWQQEVKFHSSELSKAIVKKHGGHINKLFEVKNGEYISDITTIMTNLVEKLSKLEMAQYGAINEFLDMLVENPSITLSEEDKDKVIKNQSTLINELYVKLAEGNFAVKSLTDSINGKTLTFQNMNTFHRESLTKGLSLISEKLKPTPHK